MCIYYLHKSRHRLGCRPHSRQTSLKSASPSRPENRCELQARPYRCQAVWESSQNIRPAIHVLLAYLPFLPHSESDNRRAIAGKEVASTFLDRATPWVSFLSQGSQHLPPPSPPPPLGAHGQDGNTLISQKPAFRSRCFAASTTWKAVVISNQLRSSGSDSTEEALTSRRSIGERQEVQGVFLGHGCAVDGDGFWNLKASERYGV